MAEDLSLAERLQIFYGELEQTSSCRSPAEALALIRALIDEVEDTYSGVEKNPNPPLQSDGRMYPPQDDHVEIRENGSTIAQTKGYEIELGSNGSIQIRSRFSKLIEFEKEGVTHET